MGVLTFAFRVFLLAVAIPFLIPIIHTIVLIPSSIIILDKIILRESVSDDLFILIFSHRVVDLCVLRLSKSRNQLQVSPWGEERTLYCLIRDAPPRAAFNAANLSTLLSPDLLALILLPCSSRCQCRNGDAIKVEDEMLVGYHTSRVRETRSPQTLDATRFILARANSRLMDGT